MSNCFFIYKKKLIANILSRAFKCRSKKRNELCQETSNEQELLYKSNNQALLHGQESKGKHRLEELSRGTKIFRSSQLPCYNTRPN